MLRKIRTFLATLSIVLITLLFLDFTGTLHGVLGWMAKVQFLPAVMALNVVVVVALVLLTLLMGRIHCSVICPLGIMQDVIARLRRKRNKYGYSPAKHWLRYPVLLLFIAAMVFGLAALTTLLAPYSSFGRIAQNLLQPIYLWGNNLLAAIAEHYESYTFYSVDVWVRSLPTFIVAAVTLVVVGFLAFRGGRTYCNTICPVGTLLGLVSKFSLFGIVIDKDKCRKCGKCAKNCKSACIDPNGLKVDATRCVMCGDCLSQCSFNALHFGNRLKAASACQTPAESCSAKTENSAATSGQPSAKAEASTNGEPVMKGRRDFLAAAALVTSTAALAQAKKKVDGGLAAIEDKVAPNRQTPILPPGSISARNMQRHCTSCQLCVSKCPNHVLRPSADMARFMQPEMSYEHGFCRPECTRCSELCPAGAIRPITAAEKTDLRIGRAVWISQNCIPLLDKDDATKRGGDECGNCARHCPSEAITMTLVDRKTRKPIDENDPNVDFDNCVSIPVIDESKCIGCGACEHVCPGRPSAIYVEGLTQQQVRK